MKRTISILACLALSFAGLAFGDQIVREPPTGKKEKDPIFSQWVRVTDLDTDISKMPNTGWQDFFHPIPWAGNTKFHSAYYKGSFDWDGQGVVRLGFGAVNHKAKLWVNGKLAGTHMGGYLPFSFDITGASKSGINEVVLGATDFSSCFKPGMYSEGLDKDSYKANSLLYPIGSTVALSGMLLPSKLTILPQAHIERMWIKTSVNLKKIAVRVDLAAPHIERQNNCQVSVWVETLDQMPAQNIGEETVDIPQDGSNIEIVADWINPKLWSPEQPNLYRCVAVLSKNGKELHRFTQEFGFREFESRGGDLYLNGKKIILRGTSKHYRNQPAQPLVGDYAKELIRTAKALNSNCLRLHANPYPEEFLTEADRQGILIINESAAWCFGHQYDIESEAFWVNLRRMWDEHIARDYNHPSWVIASVENELLLTGGSQKKNVKPQFAKLGKYVKEMSGRLLMFEGDDDPDNAADIPNLHYPWEPISHVTYPQDAYFLGEKFFTDSYPGTEWSWNHTKALYMGEILWLPESPHTSAVTEGDNSYEDIAVGRYRQKERLFSMYVQAFREQGVEGFCPWNPLEDWKPILPDQIVPMSVRDAYEPLRFFVLERDSEVFSGKEITRKVTVQNFSEESKNLTLVSKFEGREQKWTLPYRPSDSFERVITLSMPATDKKKSVPWTLTLMDGDKKRYEQTITFTVHPKTATVPKFTLYSSALVAKTFKDAGFDFTPATKIADIKSSPVVVAPDTLKAGDYEVLVSKGLKPIIFYPQPKGTMPTLGYRTEIPSRRGKPAPLSFTTMTWVKKTKDYAFDNVLKYFAGDNIVALGGFDFLPGLPVVPIAEAGTSKGPMMTAFMLPGKAILSSIPVVQKISSEPRCREIFAQLLSVPITKPAKSVFTVSKESAAFVSNTGFSTGKTAGINYLSGNDVSKVDLATIKKTFQTKDSLTIIDRPILKDTKFADLVKAFDPTIQASHGTAKPQKGVPLTVVSEFSGMSRGDIFAATAYSFDWRKGVQIPLSISEMIVTKATSYTYIAGKSLLLFKNKAGARLVVNLLDWDRSVCTPLGILLSNLGVSTVAANYISLTDWQTDSGVILQAEKLAFIRNGKATTTVNMPKDTSVTLSFSAFQQKAGSENAIAKVAIDGKVISTLGIPNTTPKTFTLTLNLKKGTRKITFEFANDYYKAPEDRNLYISNVFMRF
jgi:hypothetical protein